MADSSVANAAKESAQAEFSHGLQDKPPGFGGAIDARAQNDPWWPALQVRWCQRDRALGLAGYASVGLSFAPAPKLPRRESSFIAPRAAKRLGRNSAASAV